MKAQPTTLSAKANIVTSPDQPVYFSMDEDTFVNRLAELPFKLDEVNWPSIEHYYQAMSFRSQSYQARIAAAPSAMAARKLGKTLLHRRVANFKDKRSVLMSRAVYTQSRTHSQVAQRLLDSDTQRLVESSQFDYFWGCGRDQRGRNEFGELLMKVRLKLAQEAAK